MPDFAGNTFGIVAGDVDGDGDIDTWFANGAGPRLNVNLTRQLAWRSLPRRGQPLALDVYGKPWELWFLDASVGPAHIPLPPFGTLRIDPRFSIEAGAGGRASVVVPVPRTPAVVGQTLYWQAIVTGPVRLTNLEVTTITNL